MGEENPAGVKTHIENEAFAARLHSLRKKSHGSHFFSAWI
jgi:hypothetical protein